MRWLNQLWAGFVRVSERVGHAISKYVVTPVLYYGLGLIFTSFARAGDPLHLRARSGSRWSRRPAAADGLEQARSMF